MKKYIITLSVLTGLLFALVSCQYMNGVIVRGNGEIITEQRELPAYEGVNTAGSFSVKLVHGHPGTIRIRTDKNILPVIITEVEDGILDVHFKNNVSVRNFKVLELEIPVLTLKSVEIAGSGDVKCKDTLKGDRLKLSIAGSGRMEIPVYYDEIEASISGSGGINLNGECRDADYRIAGSGAINVQNLQTENARIKVAGSGNIFANVQNNLTGSIAGACDLYLYSRPENVDVSKAGVCKIVYKVP